MTEQFRQILHKRPRRLRGSVAIRQLVTENCLHSSDFVWPLFVHAGKGSVPVASLPGISRLDEAGLLAACQEAMDFDLPAIALFPAVEDSLRTADGIEAINDQGLIQKMVRSVKQRYPELLVVADVALDPYTSHGQDGLVDAGGKVQNDRTVAILVRQALSLANAGADIIAPSDMMDGRISAIRNALEQADFTDTKIMSYAIKYASCLYGPFRDAVRSGTHMQGDKKNYQMNPANSDEAFVEVDLDIDEGADMVMIKPGLPYLDIVSKIAQHCKQPVFAYQVSGEYAMIEAAAENGWLDGNATMLEVLLAFKRAGCRGILTYYALRAAKLLRQTL